MSRIICTSAQPLQARNLMQDIAIAYQPGWVFDRKAAQMDRFLSPYSILRFPYFHYPPPRSKILMLPWWATYHQNRLREIKKTTRIFMFLSDHFTWRDREKTFVESAALADVFFCSNEILQKEIRELQLHPDPQIFEDGVDTDLFHPKPRTPPGDTITVGWAGSTAFRDVKQFHLLRQAVSRVKGITLHVIDRCRHHIPHAEMPEQFYSKIDAWISVSKHEGGPNPMLEACASGLPFMAPPIGVIPKIYERTRGGILLPDSSLAAIIAGLKRLQINRHLFREWGGKNREEIVENWTWEKRVAVLRPFVEKYIGQATPKEARPVKKIEPQYTPIPNPIGEDCFSLRRCML